MPRRERRVAGRDLQRVDPDHPVGDAVEPHHLLGEHGRVAAVPAVGQDDDDRAPRHATLAPVVVELRGARHRGGCRRSQSTTRVDVWRRAIVGVADRELAGDAREPGAERERLDLLASGDGGVHEPQQRPRVRLHRSADVEQQHEPAVAGGRFAPVAPDRLAARLASPPEPCGAGRVGPVRALLPRRGGATRGASRRDAGASSAAGPRPARRSE